MTTYRIISDSVLSNCKRELDSIPLDGSMQVKIEPYKKPSSNQQRKLMFGLRLAEIADQAWIECRQYPVSVWHEYLKAKFLPEHYEEGITMEGYTKYIELPDGSIKVVGSTTKLTTKGHVEYMTRCEAYAAQELGVKFSC